MPWAPWWPPRPPPVLVALVGCGVPGHSSLHGDMGTSWGQHSPAMLCAGDVQHRAGRLEELEGRKRGDEGCWGPRTGAGDKDVLQEDRGLGDRDALQWGWRIGDRDARQRTTGAGVRDALEQVTDAGTRLLCGGRRTWGQGCSRGGRSPSGAVQPLGSPQPGPLCTHVPVPSWGCSGQCPALPRGTARPPPVLSSPPLPEPARQHLPAGPKCSPRP